MSISSVMVGLIVAGALMALSGLVAMLVRPQRRVESVPWLLCGLALCAFAIFDVGGQARESARASADAFKAATAALRKTEASYRTRTGRWQTDPDVLSLQIGCYGVAVDWVGPAGKDFRAFPPKTEVAIIHRAERYQVVALDVRLGGTAAMEIAAGRREGVSPHPRAPAERAACRV